MTNGELQTFKRCRRQWYLANYRKLGKRYERRTGPAALGTRVHAALAGWYVPPEKVPTHPLETLNRTILEDQEKLVAEEAPADALKKFEAEAELARAMVEGYIDWVEETAADRGIRIIAPEMRMTADPKIEDMPDVRLLAKLDVRAERELDGARVFIDHKTVDNFSQGTQILHLDEQMLHYHLIEYLDLLASDHASMRTDGAIYSMLRKVKRTKTSNPPYYQRVEVRHNQQTLDSYLMRVTQTIRDIENVKARLNAGVDHRVVAYPRPTKDCTWQCDYFSICGLFDDGSRVEDYIDEHYVEINPLKRYDPEMLGATN